MKVTKKNLAKTVTLAVVMATAVSVASAAELQTGGAVYGYDADYTLATDDVTLSSDTTGIVLSHANVTIGAGQTLTLTSTVRDWMGVGHEINVNSEGENNGKLVIHRQDVLGCALGEMGGVQKLYANEIVVKADDGCGIYASNFDGDYTLNAKKITIEGNYGKDQIDGQTNGAAVISMGKVTIENFDELTITQKNTSGITGEGGQALFANSGKIIINGKKATLSSQGRSAIGALNGGTVTMNVDSLDVTSDALADSSALRKNSVISAVGNDSTVDITVNDTLTITSGDDTVKNAIGAEDSGTLVINSKGTTQVDGNISALTNGLVKANFGDQDSYLKGSVTTDSDSTTKLTFENGATWINHDSSTVTEIISNGGIIDIGESGDAKVGTLTGSDLTIRTDSIGDDSGWVDFGNDYDTYLTVMGTDKVMSTIEDGTYTQTDALKELTDIVDSATTIDKLVISAGNIYGEITADVDENYNPINIVVKENTSNAGIIDMTALSLVSWRGEFDDLNNRLGDLRSSRADNGLWTRFVRGESSYNSVTNQSNMYQIGYDKQAGDWTVGLAYSYTDGKSSFANGSGENTHNVFSVYGTKMNENGTYLDLVAKYGNLDYEYTVRGGAGNADYDTDAYAFSAEVGKRITSANGAWIEPQFQFTYGTVDGVTFNSVNNIKIRQDSVDSFVARAGIMAGKPFAKGDIYLRASYLYDFDGEVQGTFMNGSTSSAIDRDLGGGWWEVGVGMRTDLSDVTHFYLDFEKAFAGEVDTDWKWNAGVRYSF